MPITWKVAVVSALNRPRRLFRSLFGRWYAPYALRRIARRSEAWLLGRSLLTDPEVLHPVYFRSTRILSEYLQGLELAGKHVLDMGSGSGAIGVFAGLQGARVTACDINPRAVALTRQNLARHHVEGEVFESDLFTALAGRVFDLICFNIPFYAGEPRSLFEAALFGGQDLRIVRTFAARCLDFLTPDGTVLIVFSEDADRSAILPMFTGAGLVASDERIAHRLLERFHVVSFQRPSLPRSPVP